MIIAKHPCPLCGPDGYAGFVICSDGSTMAIICAQCEAIWLDPAHIERDNFIHTQRPDSVVPDYDCSVTSPHARWATRDEVISYGWGEYVVGEFVTPG